MTVRLAATAALSAAFAAALVLSRASPAAAHEEAARALVSDHAAGRVHVVDLADGRAIASYDMEGPARLHLGASGRYVFAVQRDAGRVSAIDSGIEVVPHGDHADIRVGPPALLPVSLAGPRPVHFNRDGARVAVFFDGDGTAALAEEAALVAGGAPTLLRTASPHHGVAKPMGDLVAISVPHPSDPRELPVGIALVRPDGARVDAAETCPRLHGEAQSGRWIGFGCADGVLLVARDDRGAASFRKLPYPADLPAGRMVRNMAGGTGLAVFAADFGPDAMAVVEPEAGTVRMVGLPARRIAFALDAAYGDALFVLTEDGALHRIDTVRAAVAASRPVVGPYGADGGSAVARPRLASRGEHLVVTDPARGLLLRVDPQTLETVGEVPLGGTPSDVVLVAAEGETH
jgi:DNA-binding beta-propeller fold protein YncE